MTLRRMLPFVSALVAALAVAPAAPARAGETPGWIRPLQGHLAIGYAQLFVADAPGGSISFAGGVDAPLGPRLRAGVQVGFDLLGSRTARLDSSSVVADVDYSAVGVAAMLHWEPSFRGPLGRLSAGAGLYGARAAVSSIAAAQYENLGVHETVPGFAASAVLVQRRPAPVRVGFEAGVRVLLVPDETWTIGHARLTFLF